MTAAPSPECPDPILEFADQVVQYVKCSLDVDLDYTSDTLPVLDHYLQQVPANRVAEQTLFAMTAGAYFGEVIRRRLGGKWEQPDEETADEWRLVLPGGLSFSPAQAALGVITRSDVSQFDGPPRLLAAARQVLERMTGLTEYEYYTLGSCFDTLEHLQSVLVAIAAEVAGQGSQAAGAPE